MNIYPRTKTEMPIVHDLCNKNRFSGNKIHCAYIMEYYLAMKSNEVSIPATAWTRHENSRSQNIVWHDCIYTGYTEEVTLQKHNAAQGLPITLESGEIGGTMYQVSFGVDEAIWGLEMVVTQQYGYTTYHRTIQFLSGGLMLYEFYFNNYF